MRQRVMIAMAIACRPKLLIADEPTTALDVTVQAQILALLRRLQQTSGAAMLLITHNLAVVAQVAQRVTVMYAGRIVESGPVRSILKTPQHPYTLGLIGATPGFSGTGAGHARARLADIGGMVPSPGQLPSGCAFAPRCFRAVAQCREERPTLAAVKVGHDAACFFPGGEASI
jgi:peptide/nickel transport system ATP-binding protein